MIHKMQIVLKEMRVSHFWISLINEAGLIKSLDDVLIFLLNESMELANITAKSIVTAKLKIKKN